MNTDLNTIANSKNNFLILDDEEAEDGENAVPEHREGASEGAEPIQQFKKPMLKGSTLLKKHQLGQPENRMRLHISIICKHRHRS